MHKAGLQCHDFSGGAVVQEFSAVDLVHGGKDGQRPVYRSLHIEAECLVGVLVDVDAHLETGRVQHGGHRCGLTSRQLRLCHFIQGTGEGLLGLGIRQFEDGMHPLLTSGVDFKTLTILLEGRQNMVLHQDQHAALAGSAELVGRNVAVMVHTVMAGFIGHRDFECV